MRTPLLLTRHYFLSILYAIIAILFFLTIFKYPGQGYIYVLFTIASNALLYYGFRRNAIFFDTFIGVFFWLGFWLKLSVRVAFMGGQFHEPVGSFDGSGAEFDQALLVASCGFFGLLVASKLRERYMFTYPAKSGHMAHDGLHNLYLNHRKAVLSGFVILFVSIASANLFFSIYQRGAVPKTILPYGLTGAFSWLLLFGLASISSLIMHHEFTSKNKTTYFVVILGLMESFLTNVSLLSRGMILNTSALAYGVFRSIKYNTIKTSFRFWIVTSAIFVVLFGCSVAIVNHLRTGDPLEDVNLQSVYKNVTGNSYMATPLFLDRWVGIEGVIAVTSHPGQGWKLWSDAWRENYSYNKASFYDTNIITSPYIKVDMTKSHYVSLPGILAFCFYPGSFPFLFACMFLLGVIAAVIEISVYRLGGGNVILCALLAQVVAYRYAHYGYVPGQSYLLFGALFLNLLIIYYSNKYLQYRYTRAAERARPNL